MSRVGPSDSIVKQRVIASEAKQSILWRKERLDCFRLRAHALRRTPARRSSPRRAETGRRVAPRNDVGVCFRDLAARCARVVQNFPPQKIRGRRECRALQCARSLACENKKHDELVTTVTPETPGIPRAMVLTVSFVLFLVSRAFLPPSLAGCRRKLDASVGASEPHVFAVRLARHSSKAPKRPPHPAPRS